MPRSIRGLYVTTLFEYFIECLNKKPAFIRGIVEIERYPVDHSVLAMRPGTSPPWSELGIEVGVDAENTVSNHYIAFFAERFRYPKGIRPLDFKGQNPPSFRCLRRTMDLEPSCFPIAVHQCFSQKAVQTDLMVLYALHANLLQIVYSHT
jgi:hypothetical protein